MSRSSRAWAKGCELVGAAVRGVRRLGKLEARESLEPERLVRTRSSLATLTWVATAVMLMLAWSPALALSKSASHITHPRHPDGAQFRPAALWWDKYPQTYRRGSARVW